MAYMRGSGSVEVELSKTQSWIETADPILFGRNGDVGLIREHQGDRAARREHDSYNRRLVAIVALLGTVAPIVIKILELTHVLPK